MTKNEKYPIEVALEKFFNRICKDIHRFIVFYTTIPKGKEKRMYWIIALIVWLLGVLAWTIIVAYGFRGLTGY